MEHLKALRQKLGVSQQAVADYLEITRQAYSNYENGNRAPDNETLLKLAEFFNVSVDFILRGADRFIVPVLGDVAAGIPIEAITDILDYEEIDKEMAAKGEYFGLRLKGRSMEPRMMDGDVVIVRRQETAETGDTVVALVNGDSATVKKINYGSDGITLIPNNPSYDIQFYSAADVERLPVRVIGRVVELRGKM